MGAGTQSNSESASEPDRPDSPEISVCKGGPGKSVFMESGNSDGWISSDVTIDVTR
ncbi:hypothetical protein [Haloferax sulfurifontis]|uniref:Uncharacterized protein n=1 Tax=Haloferax sulfurifontis TaxID=255616 RepID=A0A830DVT3_9EURY|nr:hypothetical protein [Haloferax sulfurifontis]GGC54284.1 hypothetical protein GCM10007209_15030 [Haloferax sulfurifontis]